MTAHLSSATSVPGFDAPPMLRISSVACVPLVGEAPKGGWASEIRPEDSIHALIAVHTEDGPSGYGSVFTNGHLAREALQVLKPLLEGANALETGRTTEILHQNTFWMGRGGTITHVISGINIALWDILGKVTGLPVSTLLGGRHIERIRPYCSLLMDEPEIMRDTLARYREQGYRAFKIGWGPFGRRESYRSDEAIIAAARSELPEGYDLFVDAGASDAFWPNGLKWALRTAEMLRAHEVGWFEEALVPDDVEGFVTLRANAGLPITGGEVLTRRQAFQPFIERGAFDIIQPDVTKVGGISEQKLIREMAACHGVEYVGHGWNTALGLAADLQMAAAFPNTRFVEYIGGSAYVDGLLARPFELNAEGYLEIPFTPGLGVAIDAEKVRRYAPDADDLRLA
ncbi:mandelate racemase/muconate lactonizing enzyme family protein [Sinorhizobium medicae]|uniref:mandelate racemase/muconate lactonizing enzyme family protein n=1 Tax=Sinorhizobium medicae TaxID=110321 RepID=UPI002AF6ADE7|nr:mandelate racemase/muconate lactonizing enzyme family protein [Sinorhizobium medicae]WQO90582.1 mandelate racemase/muconate lactonizing enzyme family protein [Sinorhizobium medicae]